MLRDPGKSTQSGTPGADTNESATLQGEVYVQIGANQKELLQRSSKIIKTSPPGLALCRSWLAE